MMHDVRLEVLELFAIEDLGFALGTIGQQEQCRVLKLRNSCRSTVVTKSEAASS
jgi:hypothetical protein